MGDMAEVFRAMTANAKDRRIRRYAINMKMMKDYGVEFTSHNNGYHLIIKNGDEIIDFWPSTSRWRIRGKRSTFGNLSLLKRINKYPGGK